MRFRNKIDNIKFKMQKVQRGYSDIDVWNIHSWFLNTIVPMLKQLKETHMGYPCGMTSEEWEQILDKMIFCFTEANEETCSQKNEYQLEFDNMFNCKNKDILNDYTNREIEIDKYMKKNLDEGLDLFKQYFYDLWD